MVGDWYTIFINPAFLLWAICTVIITVFLVRTEPPPGITPAPLLAIVSALISLLVSRGILMISNYYQDYAITTVAIILVLGIAILIGKNTRKD